MKSIIFSLLFFFTLCVFSQKTSFPVVTIPDSLKQNANAVLRVYDVEIEILSQQRMKITTNRVITVLNEDGLSALRTGEHYDKKSNINNIEATVYNSNGTEIKKIKRKDFKDFSNYDGYTMLSDTRILALDYTPTEYPFTMIYESEKTTSNTAFIPSWFPLNNNFTSLEKVNLTVSFPANLGFKKKEINFESFPIKKIIENETQISYTISNIVAAKPEQLTPANGFLPELMMGLESFNLEGVDGTAKTWRDYGKWYADKILAGTNELTDETVTKIKALVGNETDPLKKAKIIYKFVQDQTRYVSIQIGIGGWKPMNADDVNRLGYGDCKALSNYTKSLLEVVNVPSYNTILYGNRNKQNFQEDFVSMQGNHMILCVPHNNKNIFLECTSQEDPFGYQANFTDDRAVLIIKPEGGEIVKTTIYPDKDNTQMSRGNYNIDENGNLTGTITMVSNGTQYGQKFRIQKRLPDEKDKYYKEYWDNISNLKIMKIDLLADKENINFTEKIEISAENYGKINNNEMFLIPNVFNHYQMNLKRVRNRKTPFEIQRGFFDVDEIEFTIPKGFSITFLPNKVDTINKYGEYKTEIIKKDINVYIYKRSLLIKSGLHPKTEYEPFRQFMDQIERNDNAKIILTNKF